VNTPSPHLVLYGLACADLVLISHLLQGLTDLPLQLVPGTENMAGLHFNNRWFLAQKKWLGYTSITDGSWHREHGWVRLQ